MVWSKQAREAAALARKRKKKPRKMNAAGNPVNPSKKESAAARSNRAKKALPKSTTKHTAGFFPSKRRWKAGRGK